KKLLSVAIATFAMSAFAQEPHVYKTVSYYDGDQKLTGVSVVSNRLKNGKPGVLILPAWKGIDDHSKEVAQKLAMLGHNVFIADIYGEGNYPKDSKEAAKISGHYKKNFADYQRRIDLALKQLVESGANADNIAAIGYCFGGTGVLEA